MSELKQASEEIQAHLGENEESKAAITKIVWAIVLAIAAPIAGALGEALPQIFPVIAPAIPDGIEIYIFAALNFVAGLLLKYAKKDHTAAVTTALKTETPDMVKRAYGTK